MRFLVDARLPPALARLLTDRGHHAEHVNEVGLGAASDSAIWLYAIKSGSAIITKDEDFAELLRRRDEAPPVVWVRVGNTSRRSLLEWFGPLIDSLVGTLAAGERLVELR